MTNITTTKSLLLVLGLLSGMLGPNIAHAGESLSLPVPPIRQILDTPDPAVPPYAPDGGYNDCSTAAEAMILKTLVDEGLMKGNQTDYYKYVRTAFRKDVPNPTSDVGWETMISETKTLSDNQITASGVQVPSDGWTDWVRQQLRAKYPIVAVILNWQLLEAPRDGVAPHSVVISGIDDTNVTYVDPQDGNSYYMALDKFKAAWGDKNSWGAYIYAKSANAKPGPATSTMPAASPTATSSGATGYRVTSSWLSPAQAEAIRSTHLHFSASASALAPADGAVDHIDFTIGWSDSPFGHTDHSKLSCTGTSSSPGGQFACDADLQQLGVPPGRLWLSYVVNDKAGNSTDTPDGERPVLYQPPIPGGT